MMRFYDSMVHVLAPLAIGAAIYLIWRDPDLLVFHWAEYCGLSDFIFAMQGNANELDFTPYYWVRYRLPDGLWLYSLTSAIIILWDYRPSNPFCVVWILVAASLGVGSELGQYAGFVAGTFDIWDILFYLMGVTLPLFLMRHRTVRDNTNEA